MRPAAVAASVTAAVAAVIVAVAVAAAAAVAARARALRLARSDFSQSITSLFTHRFLCSAVRFAAPAGSRHCNYICTTARRGAFRILLTEFHRSPART